MIDDNLTLAITHFDNAYKLHLDGKLEEAIEAYQISIEFFPTAKAHTFLGWAYSLLGKFDEAILECHLAIELEPDFGNPYNDIGSYLISLGKYDDAMEWLDKALDAEDYDQRHFPYYNMGMIHEKKGEWFTAMRFYNDALEIYPDYEAAQTAILRLTTLLN